MTVSVSRSLQRLARLSGVQLSYLEQNGTTRRHASDDELLAVLRALGLPIQAPEQAEALLRERRLARWRHQVPAVLLAWEGAPVTLTLRLPAELPVPAEPAEAAVPALSYSLRLEDGQPERTGYLTLEQLPALRRCTVEGQAFTVHRITLPGELPLGYHRLTLDVFGQACEALVIAAPLRAWQPEGGLSPASWGVFLPLYALHSAQSWGAGDLSDLHRLQNWVADHGGSVVATLPMLACFLREQDGTYEPSPYNPASRLFWSEFFVDPRTVAEFLTCPAAQALVSSPDFQAEVAALQATPHVDYGRLMALKRRVFELLAAAFHEQPAPERRHAFEEFLHANPAVRDYAAFRAAMEQRGQPWMVWPEPQRGGTLLHGDYDDAVFRYHLYVQWIAQEQLATEAAHARQRGAGLYLDLPLGVHPDGYDVWRHNELFALGASAGAPPDDFFAAGQDWGFPPMHPQHLREQGHAYFIQVVRQLMSRAGILRIDHVACLHRLYWIPRGMGPKGGVYVGYPAAEFYAILSLESHRAHTVIVGEDLGTIPPYVGSGMQRHQLLRMGVLQFNMTGNPHEPLQPLKDNCVASLNTHDTATFAGFWRANDINDLRAMNLIDEGTHRWQLEMRHAAREALREHFGQQGRPDDEALAACLRGCLRRLAESHIAVALVSLEDLWLEPQPQNVPGTWRERPNWLRKASRALEQIERDPQVLEMLHDFDALRRRA